MNNRKGFTLVELLIVVVLGGLVLASVFQVLVSNQQVYTAQSATVLGQQTVRGGVEFLSTEIRELSPGEGDLITMQADRIDMRVMRSVGVVCGVEATDPLRVRASIMGAPFADGDSVLVFADADTGNPNDDYWSRGVVTATPATGSSTCGGEDSRRLEVTDLTPLPLVGQVEAGTLIRSFRIVGYGLVNLDGETYLGRFQEGDPDGEAIIGPVAGSDGVRFDYLDQNGDPTTVSAEVRTVRITVRTVSGARDRTGRAIQDSLSVLVNPRN